MIQANIVEQKSGQELYIADQNGYKILITHTHAQMEGLFNAKTLNAPGTVIIAEPKADGALAVTDLIITSDKTNLSVITIQFTDGTNTIPIIIADMTDAPVNLATSFTGFCKGWKNARVELVVTGGINPTATAALGYFKLQDSLLYDEWDSIR